jgi:translation initiation factor 4B
MASTNSATSAASATANQQGAKGAKKGKMKGTTLDLANFLSTPINWAEEMEELSSTPADPDHNTAGDYTSAYEVRTEIIQKRSQLPTAPKSALETSFDPSRVPTTPPFSAYMGNIAYDASEADVERFFNGLRVTAFFHNSSQIF